MEAYRHADSRYDWIGLPARLLMSSLFLLSGFGKLTNPAAAQGYMHAFGVPGVLVWPAGVWELTASLLLILGLWIRPVAALLAGWCVLTAAIFHSSFSDQSQMINFLKNIVIAGAFLSMAITGIPGWSLRSRLGYARQARVSR